MKDRIASDIFSGAYYSSAQDQIGICYTDAQNLGLTVDECFNDGMMKDLVIINMEEGTRYKLQSTQGSNNTLVFKYDGQEFNPRNTYFVDNSVTASPASQSLSVTAEATTSITMYTYQDHDTTVSIKSLLADGSSGLSDTATLEIVGSSDYDKQVIYMTGSNGAAVTVAIEWVSTAGSLQPLLTQHTLTLGTTTALQDGTSVV